MVEVNINRLVTELNSHDLSGSVATHGANVAKETWANACEAAETPLDIEDRDGVRAYFKGFGAWDEAEIAAWSDNELDALVLQYAAGDLNEAQSLCAGDGVGGIDWDEYETLSSEGTISGNLFVHNDELYISLSE